MCDKSFFGLLEVNFDEREKSSDYIGFCDVFENCAKSQFWSDRDGGHVSAPISPVVVLHIISTLVLRKALRVILSKTARAGDLLLQLQVLQISSWTWCAR